MKPVFLHHNRGVRKLAFTLRIDREIKHVETAPFNSVVVVKPTGQVFLITKGICKSAVQAGRLKLVPYVGRFPRVALCVKRFLEVIRRG